MCIVCMGVYIYSHIYVLKASCCLLFIYMLKSCYPMSVVPKYQVNRKIYQQRQVKKTQLMKTHTRDIGNSFSQVKIPEANLLNHFTFGSP